MTPAEMVRFLTAAGFTRTRIAQRLGISRRSLYGWTSGTMRPTPEHLAALQALVREQPVHAAAARAAAAGRLQPLPRRPSVRPPETWDQDVIWL